MDKGKNWIVESIFNQVKKEDIETFVEEEKHKEYKVFQNEEEVYAYFGDMLDDFLAKLSYEEMQAIQNYTGFSFRFVNAVLRGNWNYEVNGEFTKNKKREYENLAKMIESTLVKTKPISGGVKVFRGVDLAFFYPYNITNLKDLVYLENGYLCDFGFTSTSLLYENSFFAKPPLWGRPNILIECLVPGGSDDGVFLGSSEISASYGQCEFLINSTSLYKVLEVEVDETLNQARLKVMLVPQKVWNIEDYERARENLKR